MDCVDDENLKCFKWEDIRSGSFNSTTVSSGFLQDFYAFLNRCSSHLDKKNSFRVIRLMAIKGFTKRSTRNPISTCENFYHSQVLFPPKIIEQTQQGDI